MIWNEARECMSRDELETIQSSRLKKLVNRVYHNVEPYRKKMQAIGLEPGDIRGVEDIETLSHEFGHAFHSFRIGSGGISCPPDVLLLVL